MFAQTTNYLASLAQSKSICGSKQANSVSIDHYMHGSPSAKVFVGISLSLDISKNESLSECLKLATELASGRVIILIADQINRFNERVFEKRSLKSGSADQRSLIKGRVIGNFFEQLTDGKSEYRIIYWQNIYTPRYQEKIALVEREYRSNPFLRRAIDDIASGFFLSRKPHRPPRANEINTLAKYIIWELPSLLLGIEVDGCTHATLIHPMQYRGHVPSNPLKELVKQIFEQEQFASLRKRLGCQSICLIDYYFPESGT